MHGVGVEDEPHNASAKTDCWFPGATVSGFFLKERRRRLWNAY